MSTTNYTRHGVFTFGTAAAAALGATPAIRDSDMLAAGKTRGPVSESGSCCTTCTGDFYYGERWSPLPYKLPIEKQRAADEERVIARYDYTRLYYLQFFWVESAWERLLAPQ